jgi:glycosyltransferase involved in cell wall biosynthesis
MNKTLVQHRENGFLADSEGEWLACLEDLLQNQELRKKIGEQGQVTVLENYSVNSMKNKYLELFELMSR